jgi:hypothetical protein
MYEHPRMQMVEPLALALDATVSAGIRAGKRAISRRRRNSTLKPGPDTPLWNELAKACAGYLRRRGDKAKLGRIVGVPRQRIHQLLVSRTACADAERTLRLLLWLAERDRGRDPA